MALTMLDPMTALIVVDLQKGVVALPLVHPIGEIVARACALADAFRARGLPVALVNVVGAAPGRTEQPRQTGVRPEGWADLIPELNRQPDDIVVTKRTWGAFASTDLEVQLKARGVTQVVDRGRRHRDRRRIDRAPGLRARLQRHPRHRRHGRQAPRGARLQHQERLSAARRNRREPKTSSTCLPGRFTGRRDDRGQDQGGFLSSGVRIAVHRPVDAWVDVEPNLIVR